MSSNIDFDESLYTLLKQASQKIAKEMKTTIDTLINDNTLKEIATFIPTSLDDLTQLGIKVELARRLLTAIQEHVSDQHISAGLDIPAKTATNCKTTDKVYIVQQIDRKIPLEEIAATKLISIEELLDDIESIYCTGIKLNVNYYVDSILSPDEQQEIKDVFMQPPVNDLKKAYNVLGDTYAKEDIRLMHIKMLFETPKKDNRSLIFNLQMQ